MGPREAQERLRWLPWGRREAAPEGEARKEARLTAKAELGPPGWRGGGGSISEPPASPSRPIVAVKDFHWPGDLSSGPSSEPSTCLCRWWAREAPVSSLSPALPDPPSPSALPPHRGAVGLGLRIQVAWGSWGHTPFPPSVGFLARGTPVRLLRCAWRSLTSLGLHFFIYETSGPGRWSSKSPPVLIFYDL